jgi:hypothetical protein
MGYEQKPGNGSLFRNDKKEKDAHPDYRGDAVLLDGTQVWLSAWIKQGKKGKFMSLSIQPKDASKTSTEKALTNADDSGVPF